MATAGKINLFGGARCGVHAYTALQSHHSVNAAWREKHQHALSPLPISMPDMRSGDTLRHAVCAVNTVPFMYLGEREVQYPDAFQALGIRHATYIKHSTHNTTLFYISIVHIEKICT